MSNKTARANVSADRMPKRRRELLSGSALAGGVLALMLTASPQAACGVVVNTVTCSVVTDPTVTTDTTQPSRCPVGPESA
jgi:hypothetical protein